MASGKHPKGVTGPAVNLPARRVVLRDLRLDDLDAWAHWQQHGRAWQLTDGPDLGPPSTAEETAAWVAGRVTELRETIRTGAFSDPRHRLVVALRDDDRLIGEVSRYLERKALGWHAVGIGVYDDALWGQGLGYEALGMWVDYLFDAHPDWRRLMMGTWSGNASMVRLAAKLGFVEEARYREARYIRGAYYDSLSFGILRAEWQARYPAGFAASLEQG